MDPYIEQCGLWGDFHNSFLHEIKRALSRVAPPHYTVRTAERSYLVLVDTDEKKSQLFLPDVSVGTRRASRKPARETGGATVADPTAEAAPVRLRAFIAEEHKETFLEIYEASPEQRLVTSIEVLSPSNKRPGTTGWEQYQRKRQSHLLGDVHLVEIDLLRNGTRMPMLDPWPKEPYVLMVAKAGNPQDCMVWPAHFRTPLPSIRVPLAKPDPPLTLHVQPLVEQVYEESRYSNTIEYTKPLTPPLAADDDAWMRQRLKANGKRSKK
jgi:hypothetical protein